MKVGCAAYSFRQYLTNGEMSLEGFLQKAVEMDVDGVELTAYYFQSTDNDYLYTLKRQCYLRGLQISAAAVGNRFTDADAGERAEQIQYVKDWVDVSVKLGAPCLRVFAGGTPEGHTEAEARQWIIDGLKECAEYAATHGVLLALENHGGITSTADQVIDLITSVDSEWVRVNLDTGNFRQSPYGSLARIAPYAVTAHAKTEIPKEGGGKEEADFSKIAGILNEQGYRGYLSIEYEAAEDAMTAVPRFVETLKSVV
ncbi:MAG: sugar phosphate isomerase/epimerase [Candidatus Poribacteria bacterium]|nr:sugar phosphate isomerase/epimerase [Candidatus Poribacteria bacterium]